MLTFAKKNDSKTMPYLPYRAQLAEAYKRVKAYGSEYIKRLDKLIDYLLFQERGKGKTSLKLDEIDNEIIPKEGQQSYDYDIFLTAEMLRNYVFDYAKAGRKGIISIKDFSTGDSFNEGETDYHLEINTFGLFECTRYKQYAFADEWPLDDEEKEECIVLNKFEDAVKRYSLTKNYVEKLLAEESFSLKSQ